MPGLDPGEALARMTEATRSIDASTQAIRDSTARLEATHRFALILQAIAFAMLGLTALGVGLLGWYAITTRHEHAALLQALTVQTQALEQRLR